MGDMAKKLNAEIRQGQSAKKAEIKTARIAMTIIITFLLSWVPYATVALIAQFGPQEVITPYVSELPVMFAKASAMHNPLIYALSHPKFREAVDKRFPWLLCCCGVSAKEKEEMTSMTTKSKKERMKRMDSVNSTAAGGTQSQISEISNLDSDTCFEEIDTGNARSVSMRMKKVKKQSSRTRRSPAPAPKDNGNLVQDLMAALAAAMAAQNGGQAQSQSVSTDLNPEQLQKAIYAISQGQLPQTVALTTTTPSGTSPTVSAQPVEEVVVPAQIDVVTTEAEVNGGHINTAYQAD
ncbi:rhodopsin [Plakobranchus ocellatus]|uniref:Rhodopsin n=1 Tax=Plakobranchus ocellatus TaxID=259542 RepID=A0AAV4D2X2_9GAST|nr:rhodopsin [Plakobranchus ocellatus]